MRRGFKQRTLGQRSAELLRGLEDILLEVAAECHAEESAVMIETRRFLSQAIMRAEVSDVMYVAGPGGQVFRCEKTKEE